MFAEFTAPVSTLVRFTAAEGAAGQCQPPRGLSAQQIFDWLDDQLGNR